MDALRYGILSTSSIAPRFIAAVRETGLGDIVALSSRSEEKAREKALQWDIPKAYGSHEALLNDSEVNIVYISTVNAYHYAWAKEALLHGKHVICEKPCTMSAHRTKELFTLAREKKCFLMEAQKMFFLPAILEVKRRIDAGDLGEISMAEMSNSFSADYNGWMFDETLGGGALLSSGIYGVQLMLYLFGEISEIQGSRICGPEGTERQYILNGRTKSGVQFLVKNSTLSMLDNCAKIYGSKGWVEIPEFWKARSATFHLADTETFHRPCKHELVYEVEHIHRCLTSGLLTSPVATEDLSVSGIAALEKVKENW